MSILIHWLLAGLAVMISAYFLPGVHIQSFTVALIAAVVLGLINAVVKPILVFFTLPITVLTLGLFLLVINGLLVLLASRLVPGFRVDGFLWALAFSIILSIVHSFLERVL